MIDFRSRAEKAADARRQVAVQEDHRQALAKMNETVAGRLAELEHKTQVLAGTAAETRQQLDTQVTALNDDISKVHAMIRAGAEQDMAMIEQMNRNNERRLNTILQLIKDI